MMGHAPTNVRALLTPGLINILVGGDGGNNRVVRTELQCQHEGGTCEFFLLCWMSGGLLQGTCGGMLKGCCHRTAKSANIGIDASTAVDLTNVPALEYGPVQNDPSECELPSSPNNPPRMAACVCLCLCVCGCVCVKFKTLVRC
uniref:Uncharacterized protein n=1 Tax=Anopheles melas TaxID=34690 RepID=A0A182UDZ5_9DIPT